MDRRAFISAAAAGILVAPAASRAQQPRPPRVYRIAFLGAADPVGYAKRIDALRAGLRELGYVEGRNLSIEFRWAEGRFDRLPELAAELVRSNVDVIVTHSVPPTLAAKRLEVLKDILPRVRRVGALENADNPAGAKRVQAMESTARTLQLTLARFDVRDAAELPEMFAAMARERLDTLVVNEDPKIIVELKRIAELAARQRLPSIGFVEYVPAGGLAGYGVDFLALYRRAATFVDRILKGARPADLPVEQPTQFQLAINLATARMLGVTIPQSMLLRADEVIE